MYLFSWFAFLSAHPSWQLPLFLLLKSKH